MLNPPAPTTPHLAIKLTNAETDSYGVIKIKIKKKTLKLTMYAILINHIPMPNRYNEKMIRTSEQLQ